MHWDKHAKDPQISMTRSRGAYKVRPLMFNASVSGSRLWMNIMQAKLRKGCTPNYDDVHTLEEEMPHQFLIVLAHLAGSTVRPTMELQSIHNPMAVQKGQRHKEFALRWIPYLLYHGLHGRKNETNKLESIGWCGGQELCKASFHLMEYGESCCN